MGSGKVDQSDIKRPLIVVLEGNADEMCLISDCLQSSTYRVLGYQDCDKAYQRIMEELPSLAIIDVHLASEGGSELIRKIRDEDRLEVMPLIAVVTSEVEKDSAGGGADAFLTRPVDAETLRRTVESLLREKSP